MIRSLLFPLYLLIITVPIALLGEENVIATRTIEAFDASRNRPVTIELWYPTVKDAKVETPESVWEMRPSARNGALSDENFWYPLIIMSHASGGDRFRMSWLAEQLAEHGYIVASLDHYGNTWENKIPEQFLKHWERPLDVSFAISTILKTPPFDKHCKENQVGFIGYALGSSTGLSLLGARSENIEAPSPSKLFSRELPEGVSTEVIENVDFRAGEANFKDERIKAAVLLAPTDCDNFTQASLASINMPILYYLAANDTISSADTVLGMLDHKKPSIQLKVCPGKSNHYLFLNAASLSGYNYLSPYLWHDDVSVNRKAYHNDIAGEVLIFFLQNL